ncbi:aspartate-semialdehyde dehydrogenase [Candidatus Paracaedibacter symbiosus]|uniref:aspartate-semialdehyde dehydrogenase n=1 Tax=Candidatus Paracaedibacter symbiosus TaxID=244582 RepID=UPI0005096D15|nr:aspartate-semialdehyde dehydrogenase [Candidatus Paracaedibacter symbiosus]
MTSPFANYKFAVIGATGNVGRAMLSILAERGAPLQNVVAVASARSAGRQVSYGDEGVLTVQGLDSFDFSKVQIALFSPGAAVSAEYAPKAASQGCIVIDNSSHFRMDDEIPLIIPEVNGAALANYKNKNIISNPNCSTIQLVMALKPLHEKAKIKRVVACTYQSVSGAGKEGMDELMGQTKSILMNMAAEPKKFMKPIAFNIIPQIDVFMEEGSTKEEWKMNVETKKILDPSVEVVATCVRVPVFIGHAVAAHIEFESPLSRAEAARALRNAPGIRVIDNPEDYAYITPAEVAGEDPVYVSRIRSDKSVAHGLSLWIVADNVRKGAALNAVQIAEELIKSYM